MLQLADTLGTTVEFIQTNGMEYIMEYGRYQLSYNIIHFLPCSLIIGLLLCPLTFLLTMFITDDLINDEKKSYKYGFIAAVAMFIVVVLAPIICEVIIYKASPEVYSIKEVMQLVETIR